MRHNAMWNITGQRVNFVLIDRS